MFKSSSLNFAKLQTSMMAPLLRIPKHPLLLARFGLVAGPAPTLVMRAFKTEKAKALFMGVAAHAIQPLNQPLITGIGAGIITAGHAVGWPVIKGGTGKFTNALVALLESLGVKFETGVRVTDLKQLPPHDILMLDMHPVNAAKLLESTQPKRYSRAFTNFKPGPAAFKVDYAVEGGVPWRDENVAKAGTVHLGGTAKEIIASERAIALGKMPDKPFVLVGQQYIADPARSNNNLHPVYAYAHVPHGFEGDATEAITAQIERFAPGFRERIIASSARSTFQTEQENANFIGGDILTGAKSTLQFMFGPRIGLHPYDTGVPGVYICSAATPPGPGIHGMSGYNAALRAIAKMKR